MKRLTYELVDVFTDRAFGGNPLAVFLDGTGVADETMQAIAKELNLSESTFVLPPRDAKSDYRVRIFTPGSELPMAGHPTVGTAHVLAHAGILKREAAETTVVFEEGVGPVPVTVRWKDDGAPGFIEMRQPLPTFGQRFEDVRVVAEMLSLDPSAIGDTGLPVEIVSCGVPFLFVPIDTLANIGRIRVRNDIWARLIGHLAAEGVFAFTKEVQFPGSHVHSRMFAPSLGIGEDPATGGASGPLGCYLVRHDVLPSEAELRCVSEQGIEMGRPSFIHIRIAHSAGVITNVRVGGTCHYMGGGHLDLDAAE